MERDRLRRTRAMMAGPALCAAERKLAPPDRAALCAGDPASLYCRFVPLRCRAQCRRSRRHFPLSVSSLRVYATERENIELETVRLSAAGSAHDSFLSFYSLFFGLLFGPSLAPAQERLALARRPKDESETPSRRRFCKGGNAQECIVQCTMHLKREKGRTAPLPRSSRWASTAISQK